MAKLPNITISVDNFLKDTRVSICMATSCKYNQAKRGNADCHLKIINIDDQAQCMSFEKADV